MRTQTQIKKSLSLITISNIAVFALGVSSNAMAAANVRADNPALSKNPLVLEAVAQQKAAYDIIIAQKDALIAQKDALILQRDGMIAQRDSVIAQKNALLSEKDALLSQKDAEIGRLTVENLSLSSQIADLNRQLSELNSQISGLSAQIASLSEQNAILTGQNTALGEQNAVLTAQVSQLSSQLAARDLAFRELSTPQFASNATLTVRESPSNSPVSNNGGIDGSSVQVFWVGAQEIPLSDVPYLKYVCELDGSVVSNDGTGATCSSGIMLSNIGFGSHVFRVKPKDREGNIGQALTFSFNRYQPELAPMQILSRTYRSIVGESGTQQILSNCDDCTILTSIPFDHNFMGRSPVAAGGNVLVAANGHINLSNVNSSSTQFIGKAGDPYVRLSPFWMDLFSRNGVYKRVDGVAPNRTVVFEWYRFGSYPSDQQIVNANMQVILYEGTDEVAFHYGPRGATVTAGSAFIGIVGKGIGHSINSTSGSASDPLSMRVISLDPPVSELGTTIRNVVYPAENTMLLFGGN